MSVIGDRHRLISITLDPRSIGRGNPDQEHERAIAIYDLIETNNFGIPGNDDGPYALVIALHEAKLAYRVHPANIMTTQVYGQVLLASGKDKQGAYNLLRKANKLAPDNAEIAKDYLAARIALSKN